MIKKTDIPPNRPKIGSIDTLKRAYNKTGETRSQLSGDSGLLVVPETNGTLFLEQFV